MRRTGYSVVRGWGDGRRPDQWSTFLLFALAVIAFAVLGGLFPTFVPAAGAVLLVMLAGYFLQLRLLLLFYVELAAAIAALMVMRGYVRSWGVLVVIVLAAALMAVFVHRREALGVQGNTGQAMLVDLRDRLRAQSLPARMPPGVQMEVAQRSANGEGFSGDFVLAAVRDPGDRPGTYGVEGHDWPGALEVAVVDVSGNGQAAGVRALLLSGGLSGLLGGTRSSEFLPAANAYLLRQDWVEGFATGIHLVLDPLSGDYCVRSAGHPPPVQHEAGSGQWLVVDTVPDPALGLVDDVGYRPVHGRLRRGDALVVFTDGVVEARERDLSYGIDRLTGQLARHVRRGYAGAAAAGVDSPRGNGDDDRTVVVLWRD